MRIVTDARYRDDQWGRMTRVSRPRVVIVSAFVPHDRVPHAGGQYLKALCDLVAETADLTLLAANTEANKAAAASEGAPPGTVLVGREFGGGVLGSVLARATLALDPVLRRRDQGMAFLPFAVGMWTSKVVRRAIREADVVDLQWQDAIRFAPLVRRLNPRARLVGMFHDVQSQSFSREALPGHADEEYWRAQAERARRLERRLAPDLDVVAAFSRKDLVLLGDPPQGMVIRPPIAIHHAVSTGEPGSHRDGQSQDRASLTVLCVSYLARFENDDAVHWLLRDIWPHLRAQVPDALLRIAGAGAKPALTELVAATPGVELLGYVEDLKPEYQRADVAIVPLRFGAGVKFKTVDALVRGVPVVTTPVGAEGIAEDGHPDAALFAHVGDQPDALAEALIAIASDPSPVRQRAAMARDWAVSTFGRAAFRKAVHTAYGWIGEEPDEGSA